MKAVRNGLDYGLFLITSSQIGSALSKYALAQGYQYPFVGLAITSGPLALIGIFTIFKFVYEYNGRGPLFYLSLMEYIQLGLLFGFSQILAIWALFYSHLTLIRYIIIIGATETILMPLLSWFILRRPLFLHYIISIIFALLAIVMDEFIVFERTSSLASLTASIQTGWEGPILACVSRSLYLVCSVLSKKYILQRAHYYKLFEKGLYQQEALTGAQISGTDGRGIKDDNSGTRAAERYYQKDIEDDKPRLLKKNSLLYKRFQLIKALDPNYEDLKLEEGRRDPYLENKLTQFRKLVGQNTVRVNQLIELPRFYLGFDGMKEEDLDAVWNQEAILKKKELIAQQKLTTLKELKKWEVEHLMRQEEDERQYLEEFLKDYIDLKLSTHLFHDKSDIILTKYDDIFDSMLYDQEIFNLDFNKTLEIRAILDIFAGILAIFAAFFNLEFYYSIHQYKELKGTQQYSYFFDSGNLYVLFIISAIFSLIKSFAFNRVVQNHTSSTFFFTRILSEFSIVVFASTFTNSTPSLNTNVVISIFLLFFAYFANFTGINHKKDWAEFASLLELAKAYFSNDLEVDQLLLMEIRLVQIHQLLGRNEFLRVLYDLIISKNPRQLLHSSNPVIFMRQNFDIFYNRRAQNWGGGMPRPTVEGIESTWVSSDQKDMWINSLNMLRMNYDQEKKEYDVLKQELVHSKKNI